MREIIRSKMKEFTTFNWINYKQRCHICIHTFAVTTEIWLVCSETLTLMKNEAWLPYRFSMKMKSSRLICAFKLSVRLNRVASSEILNSFMTREYNNQHNLSWLRIVERAKHIYIENWILTFNQERIHIHFWKMNVFRYMIVTGTNKMFSTRHLHIFVYSFTKFLINNGQVHPKVNCILRY